MRSRYGSERRGRSPHRGERRSTLAAARPRFARTPWPRRLRDAFFAALLAPIFEEISPADLKRKKVIRLRQRLRRMLISAVRLGGAEMAKAGPLWEPAGGRSTVSAYGSRFRENPSQGAAGNSRR